MCGIAGIFKLNSEKIEKTDLVKFTDSLEHRGPDGAGYELLFNDTIGFGHRRLSILDLSEAGKQPMSYANGRYWICYNGEVFNFQDIRKELEYKGYKFISNTDTEVILASYIEFGPECLNKFNGMWAFAIWDNELEQLFLARDRFGIKPLYYTFTENKNFAFASETRSFKYLKDFKRSFNEEFLQITMNDPYALEGIGYTPFNNILQLLPGHFMFVKKEGKLKQRRWWSIHEHIRNDVSDNLERQKEEFYDIFRDACKLRLISDVPVGTALSGGLDSSAVYSTVYDIIEKESLNRYNKDSQRAFTAVFPGLPNDEREYAKMAVKYTSGNITLIETSENELIKRIEEDTIKSDCISTSPLTSICSVYKGMREAGIRVSMDGHGVDEMLYGYRDMVYSLYNDALWYCNIADAKRYKDVLLQMYYPADHQNAYAKFEIQLNEKQLRDKKVFSKVKRMLKTKKQNENEFQIPTLSSLSDKPYDFSGFAIGERMVYNEFFSHTLPALLRNFDRAGMMNGIEIRMPFMDWRLVSFVFSLPEKSKIGNGFTKLILREAMKGKMSEDIRTRTYKVGISSPIDNWMNNPLKSWAMETIEDKALKSIMHEHKDKTIGKSDVRKIWKEINKQLIKNNL
jgi:asparagine synthase (glutamine-hydrolysing)